MKKSNEERTFKDILLIVLPKLWIIIVAAIVCGALLGVYSLTKPDTYTATSTIDVKKDSDTISIADVELANSVILKIGEKVKSDDFLITIISNIRDTYGQDAYPELSPSYIRSVVSYVPLDKGQFRIRVTTTDKTLSLYIARAFENLLPAEFSVYSSNALKAVPFNSAKLPKVANDKGTFKNVVVGFAGGAAVSAAAIWVLYIIDFKVRSKKKLEDNFAYPVLGNIPGAKAPNSAFATNDAYNSIVTNIIRLANEEGLKSLAVTSACEGENKDVVATRLAFALAENLLDKKILYVDADFRSSKNSKCSGLSNYLAEDGVNFVTDNSEFKNLDICNAGDVKMNPTGLLRSDKMGIILKSWEEKYDYIIINTPPVNDYADALFLADRVSGFTFATQKNVSSISKIDLATSRVESAGAKVIGFVFAE